VIVEVTYPVYGLVGYITLIFTVWKRIIMDVLSSVWYLVIRWMQLYDIYFMVSDCRGFVGWLII